MLDQFIYENHLGQRFVGLEKGVYLNYNDLRDYSWSYETINNRISRFYRPICDRKIPLWVHCESEAEAIDVKNKLFELAESDIQAKLPGKVFIGEYYTNGYITTSQKSNYLIKEKLCKIDLILTSDDPTWYKEHTYVFGKNIGNAITMGSGTDYPYDYSYDYGISMSGEKLTCETTGNNEFKLLIYGPATNPTVVINDHAYTVNGTIGQYETLLIDSTTKTIVLTTATGSKINWFDKRGRENYIFEPIPPGQNTISRIGVFGFDLTVIEKRSEPKWT